MPSARSRCRVRLAWLPQQGVLREGNRAGIGPRVKLRPAVNSPCSPEMFPQGRAASATGVKTWARDTMGFEEAMGTGPSQALAAGKDGKAVGGASLGL